MKIMLSIVIGTYNRLSLLQQCLDSLIDKVSIEHEVIVIDAGSTDGTLDYLESLQGVRLVNDGELVGQAKSLNRVIKALQSRYVCWLSDDNVVLGGMLDLSVETLEKHPDIGMVGLKVRDLTGPYASSMSYLGRIWQSGILNCNQGMLPTKLFREIGGFDEDFIDYGIDIDLTSRVLLAGYKVVLTRRVAVHHYRNHEQQLWIDYKERDKRIAAAKSLYNNKFGNLIEFEKKHQTKPGSILNRAMKKCIYKKWKWGIKILYGIIRILGVPLNKKTEQNEKERDLMNVVNGKFISIFDPVNKFRKPYYLVQKIPDSFRPHVQLDN